jgi:DNA (cytosine-5)-methyltransferase 1
VRPGPEQLDLLRRPRSRMSIPSEGVAAVSVLRVAGLFAGIGGVEAGLAKSGHKAVFFSEIDPAATSVLNKHFGGVPVIPDVRDINGLAGVDLLAAGFPCQDLSQAGKTAGITGAKSGLVGEVFRLLREHDPRWLLLENVPFLLSLDRGRGMLHLTSHLTRLGFAWAYRVVDTRTFGIPQRRQRVILLASRSEDPRKVLFADDFGEPEPRRPGQAFGFYWTEGNRGLGWAIDAIPTLKAGSTVGIPSPPAVWIPRTGELGTPDIRDAERLQGFPVDWTAAACEHHGVRKGARWRLVGNAVSVPLTEWLGRRFITPGDYHAEDDVVSASHERWPRAAWCVGGSIHRATVSDWPIEAPLTPLLEFLSFPLRPLSTRATAGFYKRASKSTLRFTDGFLAAVREHMEKMELAGASRS